MFFMGQVISFRCYLDQPAEQMQNALEKAIMMIPELEKYNDINAKMAETAQQRWVQKKAYNQKFFGIK